jgi:hypothetical protein
VLLDALVEFMGRRLFGPDRLRLLRDELSQASTTAWHDHDAELSTLRSDLAEVDRSLYRQTLRLEEHEDPDHPVVAMATRRIEELSARRSAITVSISDVESQRPSGAGPDEIEAMLDAVPDLRPALATASPQELVNLFDAFDVTADYDKANQRLRLAATVMPELIPVEERKPRPPRERSGNSDIAGAGFEPATFGLP